MTKANDRKRLSTSKKIAMTAGAVAALGPSAAEANVTYVDNNPISLSANSYQGATANWDVDGANGTDFQLWVQKFYDDRLYYITTSSVLIVYRTTGTLNFASRSYEPYVGQFNGRGLVGPGGRDASALYDGFVVGPTLAGGYQWGADDVLYRAAASYFRQRANIGSYDVLMSGPGSNFVNFVEGPNFLGFRFDSNGSLHYGWAEVNISGAEVTITRWAYESEANTGITIPEPSSLGLLGLGAAGLLALRHRREGSAPSPSREDS